MEPEYPEAARKAGLQGLVILEAVIGISVEVEDLHAFRSVFPALDEAAVSAVRRWRDRPATLTTAMRGIVEER